MVPSSNWFPTSLQDRAAWMDNFATQFDLIGAGLGFTVTDLADIANDNMMFQFLAEHSVEVEAYARSFRAFRDTITQAEPGPPDPAFPAAPAGTPSVIVESGIFARLDSIVKRVRVAPAYTPEIGALLGIIPVSPDRPIPADMQPTLKATPFPGNKVSVTFKRGGSNGVVVETKVDNATTWSNAGQFAFSPAQLVIPENPEGLPRSVQVRARYIGRDEPVGLYSQVDTVSTIPAS